MAKRVCISAQISCILARAIGSYASYSRYSVERPREWLRTQPSNVATAPSSGARTEAARADESTGWRTSKTVSSAVEFMPPLAPAHGREKSDFVAGSEQRRPWG